MSAPLIDKSCQRVDWFTPPHILELVRSYIGGQITLDPATNAGNYTQAQTFYHERGLERMWSGGRSVNCAKNLIWVNPPYGRGLKNWVARIGNEAAQGRCILALLPGNRFETGYIQESLLKREPGALCFIRRRLNFCDEHGAPRGGGNPYGSVLWLFNGPVPQFKRVFSAIGTVVEVKL
jgi:site-specific DNA-methyltransferase (adenine-specific)